MLASSRKEKAKTQNMKITYYQEMCPAHFKVGVIGNRKLPYILNFQSQNIDCSCPDFSIKKNLCKHLYFIIHLARNDLIFNNVTSIAELDDPEKISKIRENLSLLVDQKKNGEFGSTLNSVSIERDDCCSVCMCDLEGRLEKCIQCAHVFHYSCIDSWWKLPSHYGGIRGKCPYCRHNSGLSHVGQETFDPWDNFKVLEPEPQANVVPETEANVVVEPIVVVPIEDSANLDVLSNETTLNVDTDSSSENSSIDSSNTTSGHIDDNESINPINEDIPEPSNEINSISESAVTNSGEPDYNRLWWNFAAMAQVIADELEDRDLSPEEIGDRINILEDFYSLTERQIEFLSGRESESPSFNSNFNSNSNNSVANNLISHRIGSRLSGDEDIFDDQLE